MKAASWRFVQLTMCLVLIFIFLVLLLLEFCSRSEVFLRRVEGLFVLKNGGLVQVLFSAAKARDAVPRHLPFFFIEGRLQPRGARGPYVDASACRRLRGH
jgi:hypothetical protein